MHSFAKRAWAVAPSSIGLTAATALLTVLGTADARRGAALAADISFHVEYISEADPTPDDPPRLHCGDLWAEGNYAYIGSDRSGGGIAIYDISDITQPTFITEYDGSEMEDVEVYNGIGYFGSDVNNSTPATGTGVDIVDLTTPANPIRIGRVDASIGGHHKVHTLSVSDGFLYTTDNQTETIKVSNIQDPFNPSFVTSIDLNIPGDMASHEVMVRDGRMYVASKRRNNADTTNGWAHIYDVSNIGTTGPVLLKAIFTGGGTHTAMPNEDGTLMVVSQERANGEVRIYDISMIDEPNDPDDAGLLKTLTRSSLGIDAHSPHHSHVHGDLLFLSWYEAGLQVLNIADPANPVWVGAFDTYPGGAANFSGNWGVFPDLGLDKLLLSDRTRGLIIVDATGVIPTSDYNEDGAVDGNDFLAWQRGTGLASGSLGQGDGNRDRKVNNVDLALWRTQFGEEVVPHEAHSVPEPAAGVMASGLLLVLTTRIRGRRPSHA